MEVSYGIGVTNRYSVFYDENEDPLDVLKSTQEKESTVTAKKTDKDSKTEKNKLADVKDKGKVTAAQPPVKRAPKEGQPPVKTTESTKIREEGQRNAVPKQPFPKGERGGRLSNGNREERNNRRNEDRPKEFGTSVTNAESPGNAAGDGEFRPRSAFRGAPRGGRVRGRGRPQDTRGKREYERQSGSDKSGVKPIEKREGGGSHNWGSVKDHIEGQLELPAEETTETEQEVVAEPAEQKEGGENATETTAPTEEEPEKMTLDEWRARRGERKKPEFNIRKPGEGEDNSRWKQTFVLEKKKELEEDEEIVEDLTSEYPQRVGRQKFLDIDIRFTDTRRGGRGRGGRGGRGGGGGGERGGRGGERGDGEGFRGGYRGGRGGPRPSPRSNQPSAPKVDDEKDFPALG